MLCLAATHHETRALPTVSDGVALAISSFIARNILYEYFVYAIRYFADTFASVFLGTIQIQLSKWRGGFY